MAKSDFDNEYLSRRFGVEIEYNAFDGLDRSVGENNLPKGVYFFANQIKESLKCTVDVCKWHYTNDNKNWVIKPDSSCGLEVCSPVLQGSAGISSLAKAIESLAESTKISADERCSLHVHVEIADYTPADIVKLFQAWTCHELFFYFLNYSKRWLNCYCQPLGFSFPVSVVRNASYVDVLDILGSYKYYAINLFHYRKGKRKTVEFRIVGNQACLDSLETQMWCRLFLIFVQRLKNNIQADADYASTEYLDFIQTLRFLDLKYCSDSNEIIMWLIEKFSRFTSSEIRIDKRLCQRYIWDEIITNSQENFVQATEYLEGLL